MLVSVEYQLQCSCMYAAVRDGPMLPQVWVALEKCWWQLQREHLTVNSSKLRAVTGFCMCG